MRIPVVNHGCPHQGVLHRPPPGAGHHPQQSDREEHAPHRTHKRPPEARRSTTTVEYPEPEQLAAQGTPGRRPANGEVRRRQRNRGRNDADPRGNGKRKPHRINGEHQRGTGEVAEAQRNREEAGVHDVRDEPAHEPGTAPLIRPGFVGNGQEPSRQGSTARRVVSRHAEPPRASRSPRPAATGDGKRDPPSATRRRRPP